MKAYLKLVCFGLRNSYFLSCDTNETNFTCLFKSQTLHKTRQVCDLFQKPMEQVYLFWGLGVGATASANRQTGLVASVCKVPLVPGLSKQSDRQTRVQKGCKNIDTMVNQPDVALLMQSCSILESWGWGLKTG